MSKKQQRATSEGSVNTKKKESAKKKQRDKKKLTKLSEKKVKEAKMREIMASLQKHSSDIKTQDYDKMHSARLLGQNQDRRGSKREGQGPNQQIHVDSQEEEEDEDEEGEA